MAADMAATTCEWLHLLAKFDRAEGWVGHGVLSCAHWLSWTCSVSPGTARDYLRVAKALESLPLIDEAFAAGRLSYSKVRAVVRVADRVEEGVLLDQALVQTVSQFERTVRQFRRLDGDGLSQQRRRRATWHWDDDGMLVLSARLPPDEGALLVAALERMRGDRTGCSEIPGCPDPGEGEGRISDATAVGKDRMPDATVEKGHGSAAEQSAPAGRSIGRSSDDYPAEDPMLWPEVDPMVSSAADSLLALAERALAAGDVDSSGDDRHLLILHADLDLLIEADMAGGTGGGDGVGDGDGASAPAGSAHSGRCHLEDGPGIDRETARRIACDAALVAVLHHVGDGEPLRLGRKTRTISPAQRRGLRIRDGGCQYPGCHRRRFLDAHHVRHWAQLGPTDIDNLVLVCRFHHMLIHEGGFRVAAHPDGGWVFRNSQGDAIPGAVRSGPDGRSSVPSDARDPDTLLPGWAGESFHLWATVAALQSNPRPTSRILRGSDKAPPGGVDAA
jgi:hypothetical protein